MIWQGYFHVICLFAPSALPHLIHCSTFLLFFFCLHLFPMSTCPIYTPLHLCQLFVSLYYVEGFCVVFWVHPVLLSSFSGSPFLINSLSVLFCIWIWNFVHRVTLEPSCWTLGFDHHLWCCHHDRIRREKLPVVTNCKTIHFLGDLPCCCLGSAAEAKQMKLIYNHFYFLTGQIDIPEV